jgi:hypothetical protein
MLLNLHTQRWPPEVLGAQFKLFLANRSRGNKHNIQFSVNLITTRLNFSISSLISWKWNKSLSGCNWVVCSVCSSCMNCVLWNVTARLIMNTEKVRAQFRMWHAHGNEECRLRGQTQSARKRLIIFSFAYLLNLEDGSDTFLRNVEYVRKRLTLFSIPYFSTLKMEATL